MLVDTKRFGPIEVSVDQVLEFPEGLIGFPHLHRFVAINLDGPDRWLTWFQSVEEPAVGFVTLDPKAVFPDYNPLFYPKDLAGFDSSSPDNLVVLAVVTVPRDVRKMTANLQAPLVLDPIKRLGKQVIVASTEYTTKHYVFAALQTLVRRTG